MEDFIFQTDFHMLHTQHLSCCEHGIYVWLMARCMGQDKPIPLEEYKQAAICNARSNDEIYAMRRILAEFFREKEDGWHLVRTVIDES